MHNELDKISFILILLIVTISVILGLLPLFGFLIYKNPHYLLYWVFLSFFYCCIVPFCLFLLLIILSIKVLKKDKTKKDWMIVLLHFISIIIFGLLSIMFIVTSSNPLI